MKKISHDELITQKEAARIRGCSPQAINQLVKQGRFRTVQIGERKFLIRSEVERFKPGKPGPPKAMNKAKRIKKEKES